MLSRRAGPSYSAAVLVFSSLVHSPAGLGDAQINAGTARTVE